MVPIASKQAKSPSLQASLPIELFACWQARVPSLQEFVPTSPFSSRQAPLPPRQLLSPISPSASTHALKPLVHGPFPTAPREPAQIPSFEQELEPISPLAPRQANGELQLPCPILPKTLKHASFPLHALLPTLASSMNRQASRALQDPSPTVAPSSMPSQDDTALQLPLPIWDSSTPSQAESARQEPSPTVDSSIPSQAEEPRQLPCPMEIA